MKADPEPRHTPIVQTVFLLWAFMSLPRAWYFVRAGIPEEAGFLAGCAVPIVLGFVRDGLVVGFFLLPIQFLHHLDVLAKIPATVLRASNVVLAVLFSALLAVMMGDVEFFRYFGFHSNITYLSLLSDWEYISPSLYYYASPAYIVFAVVVFPCSFLLASWKVRLEWAERFPSTGPAIVTTAVVMAAGVAVSHVPLPSTLASNIVENYGVAFVENLVFSEKVEDRRGNSLETLLDTLPLQKQGPPWQYVDPEYPLIKATPHHLARLGMLPPAIANEDRDGDGYPLVKDSDDRDPTIHPGAYDIPRNGIDEDCSGLDADPPNVIFIHWEGIRAVNVGSIGYAKPSTPRFDEIVKQHGLLFRNAYATGAQTRWALMSVYCSILPRLSNKWIFKHNPDLDLLSIPSILRDRGYETIYVHGGFIGLAAKGTRLKEWFETQYDRKTSPVKNMEILGWGVQDREILEFSYELISDRTDPRPFFMTIATLSMHDPYMLPEKEFEIDSHRYRKHQLSNIARYSDDALGDFLERVLADEKLENTIIVVASDHGIVWDHPHMGTHQNKLWEDLVWIPLALIGKNWNVKPGVNDEIRHLSDVGPTILDRLGIQVPNPFVGHSLLRRFREGREPRAFFGTWLGGKSAGLRVGNHKFFKHFQISKSYLFDMEKDREETQNLALRPENKELIQSYSALVSDVFSQSNRLIEENRIWNPDLWLEVPEGR